MQVRLFPKRNLGYEVPTPPLIELNSNYRKPFKQLTGNLRVLHHTRKIVWTVPAFQHLEKSLDFFVLNTHLSVAQPVLRGEFFIDNREYEVRGAAFGTFGRSLVAPGFIFG